MNKTIALALLLTSIFFIHPTPAHAASEANCTVTNVGYDYGEMHLTCGSGSINYAFLTGATNTTLGGPGTCPTVDSDTMKTLTSLALTARAAGLTITVHYMNGCGIGTLDIHAIMGIEVTGN